MWNLVLGFFFLFVCFVCSHSAPQYLAREREMASLHFITTQLGEDVSLLSSVRFLVRLHVADGSFTIPLPSLPEERPAAAVASNTAQQVVAPPAVPPSVGAARPSSLCTNACSKPDAPNTTTDSAAAAASSGTFRRMGGTVPSSPYTPLSLRKHRRPQSATSMRSSSELTVPVPPPKGPSSGLGTPLAGDGLPPPAPIGSAAERRRSEFVDRWLEKLYWRNPVVVAPQKRADSPAQPQGGRPKPLVAGGCNSANPSRDAAPQPQPQPQPQQHFADATEPTCWEVVHSADVREDEDIIAQLPPRPEALQRSAIGREILMERLTRVFAAPNSSSSAPATPNHAGDITANAPRCVSPLPASSVAKSSRPSSAVGASSVALPSVSKFVERKRNCL